MYINIIRLIIQQSSSPDWFLLHSYFFKVNRDLTWYSRMSVWKKNEHSHILQSTMYKDRCYIISQSVSNTLNQWNKQKTITTSIVIKNSLKLTKNPLIKSNNTEANNCAKKVYDTEIEESYLPPLFVRKQMYLMEKTCLFLDYFPWKLLICESRRIMLLSFLQPIIQLNYSSSEMLTLMWWDWNNKHLSVWGRYHKESPSYTCCYCNIYRQYQRTTWNAWNVLKTCLLVF